ncbi:single-stranded DNA-binding protein [Coprobacillus sp. CAG:826]|jgi:single-strand DNA-binding protein|nr:single-stranded DNA-binding protein [Coprobacillus sp.]CDD91432.1 single-stranded DNA-binding protein [Coprobacillus sp. CAG:826]
MINRVVLVGRLTRDPELRRTSSGIAVASFTIAVDNRVKSGAERSASFIPCTVWNQAADNMARFTRKGSLVGVEGRLNQRTYDAKDGRKVNVLEVICDSVQFLEPKGTSTEAAPKEETPVFDDMAEDSGNRNLSSIDIPDDDLPF